MDTNYNIVTDNSSSKYNFYFIKINKNKNI